MNYNFCHNDIGEDKPLNELLNSVKEEYKNIPSAIMLSKISLWCNSVSMNLQILTQRVENIEKELHKIENKEK